MSSRFDFAPVRWIDGRWAFSPRLPPSSPVPVRIATWNVWFSDHQVVSRHQALLAELAGRDLDVIALQEVTQELLDVLLAAPWIRRNYWVSELQVIGYDVIILSRMPVHRIATIRLPSTQGRRLIVAELTCGLDVATHLESTPPMAAIRAEQLTVVLDAPRRGAGDLVQLSPSPAACSESRTAYTMLLSSSTGTAVVVKTRIFHNCH
jgi:endonuclease/exonuclease/phosphatase family metal-dependent hydrolase